MNLPPINPHKDSDIKSADAKTASAVGHIPSGIFVVCIRNDKKRIDGYLASWIQQVSFEPLLISIAIKPGRPAYDHILKGSTFSVNVAGDHDRSFLKHLWKGYPPHENPFDLLPMKEGEFGGVILNAAKSAMECKLHSHFKPGDHEIVIAKVLKSYVNNEESTPLVHIRETGLDY